MDAFERAKQYVSKENYMEIKYEDLCSSPEDVFKKVLEFCELEYTSDFERAIKKYNLKNTNYKWQRDLTDYQKKILNEVLREYLVKYGYSG